MVLCLVVSRVILHLQDIWILVGDLDDRRSTTRYVSTLIDGLFVRHKFGLVHTIAYIKQPTELA